ncbi:hypothetical protein IAG41_21850 [Sphingomonas sp. JC676]|uniref:hypothetical protein n=1 Tax=Sphingomonas sp. JC676 TaxID=2768065 RepID=UPI001657EC83|nr:hypothetical protein [Sphingomonas sp. JC676]MBC9035041.1 hypothetical protein [Sphingomonas sp. JC676]
MIEIVSHGTHNLWQARTGWQDQSDPQLMRLVSLLALVLIGQGEPEQIVRRLAGSARRAKDKLPRP